MSASPNYARMPGFGEVGPTYHTPTYDQDEAYAAVAEALVKADDVHELVQDVAEAQLALEWAENNAPREFKNRLMLLRLQAKKLAKAESDWGKENAA